MNIRLNQLARELTPPLLWNFFRKSFYRIKKRSTAHSHLQNADWYNRTYEKTTGYHTHFTESEYYFLWTVVTDRIVQSGAQRIVDLGCGPGQFATLLRSRGISSYCGVDFSSKAIALAKKVCPGYSFIITDMSQSDLLKSAQYDLVVALEFLEHITFDLDIIKQIKSGIRFIGTVPNYPYHSHVRYFRGTEEVKERYAPFFDRFTVDVFQQNVAGDRYFLIDGIRN